MATAPGSTDIARSIGAEVAELFRTLLRERLKQMLLVEIDAVLDEVLRDLPVEVQAAIALDRSDPLSHPHVNVKITAGRPG